MKNIFASNKIKDTVNEINKKVTENGHFIVLFPLYDPEMGFDEEYSVVGKIRNQTRIANLLKAQGIDVMKLANCYYIFFSQRLTNEEKENAKQKAIQLGHWYDIF